jgi:hypothetical protein
MICKGPAPAVLLHMCGALWCLIGGAHENSQQPAQLHLTCCGFAATCMQGQHMSPEAKANV